VGQQVILEGLGHVVCERIHAGIAWRRLGFTRIGALVAHQERVHHAFGVRALERMIDDDHARRRALAQRAAPYLALIDEILGTLAELFAFFAEDPLAYRSEMVTTFPGWLRAEVQPSRVDGTARETP
ncbi:MAG: hypothetical protein GWN84_02910, partial [Gammaproteobacteria bacterium]|nr:hypothetical protein [Gammaproteobacteria bacterium]NIR82098.1 hypothetical protein [Gammaproteobacteria bacterium]NIR89331.1 hypothetical protein [Gammaproteobacteria bacterium]NIU03208.1 hypothetical protein [Gammaproteobacteria bacterium]NIV74503.1 hypothetical protein [Gammaproteobacteria bacterium]